MLVQNSYDGDVRLRRKAEALVTAGYAVDVLALRNAAAKGFYTLNGVNVYTLGLGKRRGSLLRYVFEYLAFFVWALVRLSLLMVWRRYAVVEVNTLPDFLIFAAAPARWMGAKLVLDMHEITPEFYMSKYGIDERSWVVRFLTRLERMSFDFADHVITIHEPILDLLVSRGLDRTKATVVMNAVDEATFRSHPKRSESVAGMASEKFVMMYHGTLTRTYGLEFALEAFAIAQSDMPAAEFWILGDGPDRSSLEHLTQARGLTSKIRLLGSVPPSQVSVWVERCTIGVLPMRRDVFLDFAFPNKLSEYIILGKGVIIPRLKTIRHYFSEEALAYFEPNSAVDLAKQMVHMYRDSGFRSRLVANAKLEYAPIRWEVMRERYLRLIEDMVGPPRSAELQALGGQ